MEIKKNRLYRMEYRPMFLDLDDSLEEIFSHYGFFESEKLKKLDFKRQLVSDYLEDIEELERRRSEG